MGLETIRLVVTKWLTALNGQLSFVLVEENDLTAAVLDLARFAFVLACFSKKIKPPLLCRGLLCIVDVYCA